MPTCNPPSPGSVQLEMIFSMNGNLAENVFHLNNGTGVSPTHAEMTTLAHQAAQHVADGPWSLCGAQLVFQRAQVRNIHEGPGGDVVVDTTNAGWSGPTGGTGLPNNVALAIALHTAMGGRSGRGRIYVGGLTSNIVVNPNAITTAGATLFSNATTAFMNFVKAGTPYSFVVLSKWHNKVCRAEALTNAVVSVSTDVDTDSQRRRLNKRGK